MGLCTDTANNWIEFKFWHAYKCSVLFLNVSVGLSACLSVCPSSALYCFWLVNDQPLFLISTLSTSLEHINVDSKSNTVFSQLSFASK